MRKLLVIAGLLCAANSFAQMQYQKDPYELTFITDTHYKPDGNVQAQLRDQEVWQNFVAANDSWWVEFNELTGMPHRAFGKPIATVGGTPEEKAMNFINTQLKGFNKKSEDLVLRKVNTSSKYHYVHFNQMYNALEVLWSEATIRLSLDGNIVLFGMDIYNDISVNTIPSISTDAIKTFAASDFTITVNSVEVQPALKILPIKSTNEVSKYEYKLVYEVFVNTINEESIPGKYYSLVDAHTGKVYYRQNQVHACGAPLMSADVQVNSEITDNPLLATENRGLPYIGVEIDGDTYYTDFNGYLTVNFITEPTEATINLEGLYARVYHGSSGSSMETIDVTLDAGENVIEFDDLSGATPSEVSAYYQQNVVHDYMKTHFSGFTGLDMDQLIRVERTDGECNAYYDGASINFYEAGGGCPATALFNDVVFHEYGHGINYDVYDYLGGSWNNGALGEGYADLWGMCITENPNLANGFFGGSGPLREYDAAPKVYPEDLLGEVHADGEIIAGAWWDVAENFGDDVPEMAELWAETWLATPMQPGGNEGQLYSDILLEALIADDDNADLSDGTPRFDEITTAFCEHGIGLLGQVSTDHEGTLSFLSADEPISIEVELDIDYPLFIGYMDMHYQINGAGAWTTASMELVSGSTYKADIPAQEAGTIISYYLKTADENDCGELVLPINADLAVDPNLPYFALVGHTLLHTEDFDDIAGAWDFDPFGTDEAETGEWNINEPLASFDATGYQVQTSQDHTSGSSNLCAFTANASSLSAGVGENDVDNGETTLRTPVFDMSGYDDPAITYFRIYSNASPTSANPGNDVWQARISNDLENWVKIERTGTEDNSWRRNAIRVKDYVELTSTVAIIFIAQDSVIPSAELEGGSLIEGAIDDLQIWDIGAPDTTEDNIAEIENLINAIFPNPTSDYVNIFFGNVQEEMQITIINELGEIIKTQNIEAVAGGKYILDCRQIAAGIYTLNCKTERGYVNKQLVIID